MAETTKAACERCGGEMLTVQGCKADPIRGEERIPWGGPGNCGDCGARPGNLHHENCDMEICPVCGLQLFLCGHDEPGATLEVFYEPYDTDYEKKMAEAVKMFVGDAGLCGDGRDTEFTFMSDEEALEAVEKLKAFDRVKAIGFRGRTLLKRG